VGQSFRHDNRPKRRDRNNGQQKSAESRVLNHSPESSPTEENNVSNNDYYSSAPRRPSAEFFRAGQSDSDPLSLGELKPELLEITTNEEGEAVSGPEVKTRPRRIEIGKKTIFDELKDLDDAVFENQVKISVTGWAFLNLAICRCKNLAKTLKIRPNFEIK